MDSGTNQSHRQSPHIDPEVLLKQLRSALPGTTGGHWEMVSFRFSAGSPKDGGDKKDEGEDDGGHTEDGPIRPGGPRIEAAYEWIEPA